MDLCIKELKVEAIKMYINAAKLLFHSTKRDFYGFLKSCTSAKWFCQSAIKTVRSYDLYQLSEIYSDSYT